MIVFFSGSDCSGKVQRTGFLDFADGLIYGAVFFFWLLGTFSLVVLVVMLRSRLPGGWGTRQVLFEMVLPDRAGGIVDLSECSFLSVV